MSRSPYLPPPIRLTSRSAAEVDEFRQSGLAVIRDIRIHLWDAAPDIDIAKTLSLAHALAEARIQRGATDEIRLAVPTDRCHGTEDSRWLMVPHVFLWEPTGQVTLGWERLEPVQAETLMGAPIDAIRTWTDGAHRLIELATISARHDSESAGHLSVRWVLGNEAAAAEALSASKVSLDHVSLHTDPAEEALLAEVLTGVGLVEIKRPASIDAPGRWLQCGNVRIHLNSRSEQVGESTFPGTAPNHVCLRVPDIAEVERSLGARGIPTLRAGTLRHQLWWRLAGGTTIEFQQRDSVPDGLRLAH